MIRYRLIGVAVLAALLLIAAAPAPGQTPGTPSSTRRLFLPLVARPGGCPAASANAYTAGPAIQRDGDNPVRLAWNHADKNLALRSYKLNSGASRGFTFYGSKDPNQPPQLATLFSPARVPAFTNAYAVYNWNWAPSPNPGTRGSLDSDWGGVTVLGLGVSAGEALHVPTSGYDLGGGMAVIVLYADASSLTFKYTRDDSVQPNGYTLHVDNICTDPNLLAVYRAADAAPGPRYVFYNNLNFNYTLPNLPAGQVFGTARAGEVRVAIVDTGAFMDPRSCGDWWQIHPGRSCP